MSNTLRRLREPMEALALAIPAFLYLAIAVPVAFRQRAAINPDGIIYIRKAQFLLAGHFWQSVSGYWPPAISWCVALLLRLGHHTNPLHAIHAVLFFFGLTWVLAACALLRSLLPSRASWRLLAGIALAFAGVRQCVALITPDLLLGTMLMAYLALVSRGRLLSSPIDALIAGLFTGLGYLCKSYALPFFCLHFPLTVAYRYWRAQRGAEWIAKEPLHVSIRQAFTTLVVGAIGFAVFALPWVAILSHKYGHFTISMVYHHNHMNVASQAELDVLPDFTVVPPDPYISIWEGLDPGPRGDWSPWASWANLRHQLRIAFDHSRLILTDVAKFDNLGLILFATLFSLVPFNYFKRRSIFSAVPLWILMTAVVYCFGFLIVAFEVRYIVPILLPLGIALCLREWEEFSQSSAAGGQPKWFAVVPFAMVGLFILSAFIGMGQFAFDSSARPIYAHVANMLKQRKLDGMFTSSDNNKGVDVAYYLNRKMVLIPYSDDINKIERELFAAGVTEVLVWSDVRMKALDPYPGQLAAMLKKTGHWRLALAAKLDSVRRLDVYVRQTDCGTATEPAAQQANHQETQTDQKAD